MGARRGRSAAQASGTPACFGAGNRLLGLVGVGVKLTSAAVYRRDVAAFLAAHPDPGALGPDALVAWLDTAAPDNPAGWDRRAAALRHFYTAGVAAELWHADPAAGLPRRRRGDWRWRR